MMHAQSPDGKHTMCQHTGAAAADMSSNLEEVDCTTCLWGLVKLLLVQWGATLRRLHEAERSRTVRPK